MRICPTCGAHSVAPYVFCQNCYDGESKTVTRLIISCQALKCPANNNYFEKLCTEGGVENVIHATCTHSRSSTNGESYLLDTVVGMLGDLLINDDERLLKNTSLTDIMLQLDYLRKTEWGSSMMSLNRMKAFTRLGMIGPARVIADYMDQYIHQPRSSEPTLRGLKQFVANGSPERRLGLYCENISL